MILLILLFWFYLFMDDVTESESCRPLNYKTIPVYAGHFNAVYRAVPLPDI